MRAPFTKIYKRPKFQCCFCGDLPFGCAFLSRSFRPLTATETALKIWGLNECKQNPEKFPGKFLGAIRRKEKQRRWIFRRGKDCGLNRIISILHSISQAATNINTQREIQSFKTETSSLAKIWNLLCVRGRRCCATPHHTIAKWRHQFAEKHRFTLQCLSCRNSPLVKMMARTSQLTGQQEMENDWALHSGAIATTEGFGKTRFSVIISHRKDADYCDYCAVTRIGMQSLTVFPFFLTLGAVAQNVSGNPGNAPSFSQGESFVSALSFRFNLGIT